MAKKHGQGSPVAENGDAIGDVAGHAIAARTESSEAAARCAAIPRNDDGSVGTIREHLDRMWFSVLLGPVDVERRLFIEGEREGRDDTVVAISEAICHTREDKPRARVAVL